MRDVLAGTLSNIGAVLVSHSETGLYIDRRSVVELARLMDDLAEAAESASDDLAVLAAVRWRRMALRMARRRRPRCADGPATGPAGTVVTFPIIHRPRPAVVTGNEKDRSNG